MSGNKLIGIIFLLVILISCKSTQNIPEAYNFRLAELKANPYGCWSLVRGNLSGTGTIIDTLAGELIAIERDSLFLLVDDGQLKSVSRYSVVYMKVFTHRNQKNTYLTIGLILSIPGFAGAIIHTADALAFIIMGLPSLITGIVEYSIENTRARNEINYPPTSINELSRYARFPGGMPTGIDRNQLLLKK